MARSALTHYIAPSAIGITPNCNGSANDIDVYIAEGTKIKVYSPALGIDTVNGDFQEWTLTGRNRRLIPPKEMAGGVMVDVNVPYTIYARIPKLARERGAYLVFAPKTLLGTKGGSQVWVDKYSSVTKGGESVLYIRANQKIVITDPNYEYIRLGDVSKSVGASTIEGGKRTVTLDTGILGTEQFNAEWDLEPDALPLRVELDCRIDGKDAGQTPYVPWEKAVRVAPKLVEGWETDAESKVRRWSIARNTGNAEADKPWNFPYDHDDSSSSSESSSSGEPYPPDTPHVIEDGFIDIQHKQGGPDDFAGTVATTFTVTAWGDPYQDTDVPIYEDLDGQGSSDSSDEPSLSALASTSITIFAETLEKYALALSANIVSYNPQTKMYRPSSGVEVRIRATDQRGETFDITKEQMDNIGLVVDYAPVESEAWVPLAFSGGPSSVATANIPNMAFGSQKNLNVRLGRLLPDDSSSSGSDEWDSSDSDSSGEEPREVIELDRETIAYVRDGEDSKVREWIYLRSATPITFGTQDHPYPADISGGQVNPGGAATGSDPNKDQDGWVPEGWWDDKHGVDNTNIYEYGSYRDYIYGSESSSSDSDSSDSSSSSEEEPLGHWGEFCEPYIDNHYGKDGQNSVRIDLDNEADLVSLDSDGKVRFDRTVVVHACVYDGATSPTSGVSKPDSLTRASLRFGNEETGCTPELSDITDGVLTITWSFTKGMVISAADKTISLIYRGSTYDAVFSLGTTDSDTIWQVMPKQTKVSFSKNSNNQLTPSSIPLKCGYTRSTGSGTESVEEATVTNGQIGSTGMYLYYRSNGSSGWSDWQVYTTAGISILSDTTVQDYEFCISTATTANSVSGTNIIDRECVPVVKDGLNGANSIRLALDNEHEDFLYSDSQELPIAPSGGATSVIHLYDGPGEVSLNTNNLSIDESSTGVPTTGNNAPTFINTSGVIKLKVPHITADTAKVVVKCLYNTNYYYAEFTANKTSQDKYDIQVKPNAISYNSATYSPVTINVGALRTDLRGTQSDVTSSISKIANSGNLRLFMGYVNSSGLVYNITRRTGDNALSPSISQQDAATYAGVYFELRWYSEATAADSSNTYRLCDYETVEIAKAENGANAVIYMVEPAILSIKIPSDSQSATLSCHCSFYKKEGQNAKELFETFYTAYKRSGNSFTYWNDDYDDGFDISTTVNASVDAFVIYIFSDSYTENNPESQPYLAKAQIIVEKDGNTGSTGPQGKMGKNYYYAGVWNSSDETKTFSATDYETPFFEDSLGQKWVWIGENFSLKSMAYIAYYYTSPGDNENWEPLVTTFKYLMTEAIFSGYARLGDWVFNGDYMYSQKGKSNNNAEVSYNGTTYYYHGPSEKTYTPYIVMTAEGGYAHFSGDNVRFNTDGSGWLANQNITWNQYGNATFNGTVKARIYTPALVIADQHDLSTYHTGSNSVYTLKLDDTGFSILYQYPGSIFTLSFTDLRLQKYEGAEVRIVNANDYSIDISGILCRKQKIVSGSFTGYEIGTMRIYAGDVLVLRCVYINNGYNWLIMSLQKNYKENLENY